MYAFKTPAAFDAVKSMADRAAAIARLDPLEKYRDAIMAATRPGMRAWAAAVTNSPVRALIEGGGTLAVKGAYHV